MLFFLSCLEAMSVGSPSAASWMHKGLIQPCLHRFSLRAGIEEDFVHDARLFQSSSRRVDLYTKWCHGIGLTFSFLQRFDVYGVGSYSQIESHWRFPNGPAIERIEIKTDWAPNWSLGARGTLLEWNCVLLGMGTKWSTYQSSFERWQVDGSSFDVALGKLRQVEWQATSDLSFQIDYLAPYVGIKYDCLITHLDPGLGKQEGLVSEKFKKRGHTGLYIGCTFSKGSFAFLNLEARFIDEEAWSLAFDLCF
jgi:hypothetical protein